MMLLPLLLWDADFVVFGLSTAINISILASIST